MTKQVNEYGDITYSQTFEFANSFGAYVVVAEADHVNRDWQLFLSCMSVETGDVSNLRFRGFSRKADVVATINQAIEWNWSNTINAKGDVVPLF